MEFNKLKTEVLKNAKRYEKYNNIKIDLDFSVLKIIEEVGELYQALMIHQKKSRPEKHVSKKESQIKLAQELADVTGMLMVLSDQLGIDLEQAIKDKWINHTAYKP